LLFVKIREFFDESPFTVSNMLSSRQFGGFVKTSEHVFVVKSISISQNLLQVFICDRGIVMGKLREDVMENMSASDIKMESVNETRVVSINGAQSSLQPVPRSGVVMRNIMLSMLEIGVANEPHVSNEIGAEIESENVEARSGLGPQVETIEHSDNTEDTGDHLGKHLCREQLVGNEEVAGESSSRSSSGSSQKIDRPTEDEHQEDGVEREGIFTDGVSELDKLLSSRDVSLVGNVSFSFFHMVSSRVMDVMTMLPVKVGDEVNGVEDESQDIIGPLFIRK